MTYSEHELEFTFAKNENRYAEVDETRSKVMESVHYAIIVVSCLLEHNSI